MRKKPGNKIQFRISALRSKVVSTTKKLIDENRRPFPNMGKLQYLKKQRLQLKDEIRALSNQ